MPGKMRLLLAFLLVCFPFGSPATASTFLVTLFTDSAATATVAGAGDGPGAAGDLRYAMLAANTAGGTNTIDFSCGAPPCTITLNGPLPPITSNLTIDGGTFGNLIVDGNSLYRVFFVDSGAVTLSNLQVQNALAKGGAGGQGGSNGAGGGGGAGFGAGLFVNQATAAVTVRNTYFLNCTVQGGNGGNGTNTGIISAGGGGGLAFAGGAGSSHAGGGGGGVQGSGQPDSGYNGGNGGAGGGAGGGGNGAASGTGGSAYASAANGAGAAGSDNQGGAGGFGGGGGGSNNNGGAGGFGGGGGGGGNNGGNGGFGGGGGGGDSGNAGSSPSAGGTQGGAGGGGGFSGGGGGGAAAGPAIFVRLGSVTLANSTGSTFSATAGTGGTNAGGGANGSNGTASGGSAATAIFNYAGSVNSSATVGASAIPGGLPATHFSVSATGPVTAGVAASLTVTALDSNNATATGYNGTVHFTSSDSAAVLPGDTTLTNGAATLNYTLKTAGGQTITATDTVTSTITGTSSTVTVNAAAAASMSANAGTTPQSTPTLTSFGVALAVTVVDAFSNPVAGVNVTFTAPGAGASGIFSNSTASIVAATNASGVATATFAANATAGSYTVTASAGGLTSVNFALTNLLPATHFSVSAAGPVTAGVAANLTVTALDSTNATVAGYSGTVHFTSTDGAAVLPANTTLTNGTATLAYTLKTAGSQTITATDTVTVTIAGTSAAITVNPGAATHFTVAAPGTAVLGTAFNFTVTALDAYGNTATGYAGTVHFTGSDPRVSLPANSTLNAGASTFAATAGNAVNQTIAATDTVNAGITGISGTIAVSKAVLTVTANSVSISLGAPIPALTATITGFVNGDTAGTAVTGSPSLSTSASASSAPGTYPITVTAGTLAAANYTFSFVNGTLSVGGVLPPGVVLGFGSGSIPLGGTGILTFTVSNPNAYTPLAGVGFSDTISSGLAIATPNGLTGSCGTVSAAAGGNSIALAGLVLGPAATCAFSVNVEGTAAGTQSTSAMNLQNAGLPVPGFAAYTTVNVVQTPAIANSASFGLAEAAPNTILSYFGPVSCFPSEQVVIDGTAATILYASAAQINFVTPGSVTGTTAAIQIVCNGATVESLSYPIGAVNPSIFTETGSGSGQGSIVNLDGTLNTPSHPIARGSYISVYGTGFGALNPPSPDGLRRLAGTVTATIGGLNALVIYAGEAPTETSGLQQINIQVPTGLNPGPSLPIVLTIDGVPTQAGVTVSVQ